MSSENTYSYVTISSTQLCHPVFWEYTQLCHHVFKNTPSYKAVSSSVTVPIKKSSGYVAMYFKSTPATCMSSCLHMSPYVPCYVVFFQDSWTKNITSYVPVSPRNSICYVTMSFKNTLSYVTMSSKNTSSYVTLQRIHKDVLLCLRRIQQVMLLFRRLLHKLCHCLPRIYQLCHSVFQ